MVVTEKLAFLSLRDRQWHMPKHIILKHWHFRVPVLKDCKAKDLHQDSKALL